jgi:hypothetical protein
MLSIDAVMRRIDAIRAECTQYVTSESLIMQHTVHSPISVLKGSSYNSYR